jgi:uncharacterized protein (TIGR02996 family)
MQPPPLVQAIIADPDDDLPRLVFADWLEENGQEARARWIRASCRHARLHHSDPTWGETFRAVITTFSECQPAWWEHPTGTTQQNDRGLFRFRVKSKSAAARLGKLAWLADAWADGWLDGIAIDWCDGSLAAVLAKWKGPIRDIPLYAKPAPQIGDAGLAFYLCVPRLWGLTLPGHALRNPSALRLGERADLRELTLDGLPADEGRDMAAVFGQVGRLTGLRMLHVRGNRRPTDADLRPLAGLTGLRHLHLERCVAVTDASLEMIGQLPALRRLQLWSCPGVTAAGVTDLTRRRPEVQVERLG